MTGFTIEYELIGIGWARLAMEDQQGDRIEIDRLSHRGDPMADLLWAGLAAALGRTPEDWEIDHERWLSRVSFTPAVDDDTLEAGRLTVSAVEHWWIEHQAHAQPYGEVQVEPYEFARAVGDCVAGLLNRHGVEGYDRHWNAAPFPVSALRTLEAVLERTESAGDRSQCGSAQKPSRVCKSAA